MVGVRMWGVRGEWRIKFGWRVHLHFLPYCGFCSAYAVPLQILKLLVVRQFRLLNYCRKSKYVCQPYFGVMIQYSSYILTNLWPNHFSYRSFLEMLVMANPEIGLALVPVMVILRCRINFFFFYIFLFLNFWRTFWFSIEPRVSPVTVNMTYLGT